jgi:hypothetical protein
VDAGTVGDCELRGHLETAVGGRWPRPWCDSKRLSQPDSVARMERQRNPGLLKRCCLLLHHLRRDVSTLERDGIQPLVPAQAGTQLAAWSTSLGPRFRGDERINSAIIRLALAPSEKKFPSFSSTPSQARLYCPIPSPEGACSRPPGSRGKGAAPAPVGARQAFSPGGERSRSSRGSPPPPLRHYDRSALRGLKKRGMETFRRRVGAPVRRDF